MNLINICPGIKSTLISLSLISLMTACAAGDAELSTADRVEVVREVEVEKEVVIDGSTTADVTLTNASTQAQQQNRLIIYTGDISLVVKDTNEAVKAISDLALEVGGYVSGSNIYQSNEVPRGSITIRIPAEQYDQTLAALRELALRVERENSSATDITEEFVDLQARKTNLEFTETALQELLDNREQVGKTSDILEVHRELTNIRGQIEQIEGRLRFLTDQAALSTITINLTPDALYQPVRVAGWEPQGIAKEAVEALIFALQGLSYALIWLVVFVLPLLIIFLALLFIVIRVIRWGWRKYRDGKERAEPVTS